MARLASVCVEGMARLSAVRGVRSTNAAGERARLAEVVSRHRGSRRRCRAPEQFRRRRWMLADRRFFLRAHELASGERARRPSSAGTGAGAGRSTSRGAPRYDAHHATTRAERVSPVVTPDSTVK